MFLRFRPLKTSIFSDIFWFIPVCALVLSCLPTGAKDQTKKTAAKNERETGTRAKSKKETVFVLEQETNQLGRMTVYAGQTGVKVGGMIGGGNLVARAPDWKIVAFNTRDKVMKEQSYATFLKQELPALVPTTDYFVKRKLEPVPVYYAGWRALRVMAPTPDGTVGMMMPSWSGVGNIKTAKTISISVFATEKAEVPEKVTSILKAVYRLPRFGGFPLGVTFKHSDGTIGVTLKTNAIRRTSLSPDRLFSYPKTGYKPAKTLESVILSGLIDSTFMETPEVK